VSNENGFEPEFLAMARLVQEPFAGASRRCRLEGEMKGLTTLSIVALGVALPLCAGAAPVRVYVRPGTPAAGVAATKSAEKEGEAARKTAEQARESLEKALSARHGKRRENWPADAKAQLDEAWRKEMDAVIAHQAIKTDAKAHADSVDDLTKAFAEEIKRAPHLALANSPDEADLTVEALARRGKTSIPAATYMYYVKVTPGAAWKADRLAGKTFGQVGVKDARGNARLDGGVVTIHSYSEAEPFWTLEVFQKGSSYFGSAQTLAESLAAFASGLAP
jgi:imidazolonepropionase-like amidohydrolase